jgi:drug/metabolite transporter (DMT)-like permease
VELPSNGVMVLLFSCVAGTLIGYSGWLCREMVSATTYTLVGVVNKFLTILLNVALWDKHASPTGIIAVCVCLGAGSLYQQSPTRKQLAAQQQQADLKSQQDLENQAAPLLKRSAVESKQ